MLTSRANYLEGNVNLENICKNVEGDLI